MDDHEYYDTLVMYKVKLPTFYSHQKDNLTPLCLIQVKVEVFFKIIFFRPPNTFLLLSFLSQRFLLATRFRQSIWFIACVISISNSAHSFVQSHIRKL